MHDPAQDAHPDLPLLWLFFGSQLSLRLFLCLIFGLFFKIWSEVHLGWKAKQIYSLVWSWAVPKGVTFSIPSQGGRARSPFNTMPWKIFHVKKLRYFFSDCHLHLVDSAPVLGVLGLRVAGVDDLLVVVEKLLADRTLGVQVLGEVFWSKSFFFHCFSKFFGQNPLQCFSPGRWPWQGCPSLVHPRSEKKDINKRSRRKMSAIL